MDGLWDKFLSHYYDCQEQITRADLGVLESVVVCGVVYSIIVTGVDVESVVVCGVVDSVVVSCVVVESVTVVDSAMLAMVVVIKSEKTNVYLIINEGIK